MSEEIGSIKVSIFGRDYNIRGGSDSDYIRKLAAHVDSVMRDIADEMFKERQQFSEFANELTQELEEVLSTE